MSPWRHTPEAGGLHGLSPAQVSPRTLSCWARNEQSVLFGVAVLRDVFLQGTPRGQDNSLPHVLSYRPGTHAKLES